MLCDVLLYHGYQFKGYRYPNLYKLLYMERKSMTIHDTESGSRISTYTTVYEVFRIS